MVTNRVLSGPAGRPYPGVQTYILSDGTPRYGADFSYQDRRGRHNSRSMGRYDTPEEARAAVLMEQARVLEEKVARLRAEASRMLQVLSKSTKTGP
jgi:hypothetical protein